MDEVPKAPDSLDLEQGGVRARFPAPPGSPQSPAGGDGTWGKLSAGFAADVKADTIGCRAWPAGPGRPGLQ